MHQCCTEMLQADLSVSFPCLAHMGETCSNHSSSMSCGTESAHGNLKEDCPDA